MNRLTPPTVRPSTSTSSRGGLHDVLAQERRDRALDEVERPEALLQARVAVHALDDARVQPHAGREREVAAVDDPEVDGARRPAVGGVQQLLGGVDDVGRDPEQLRDDVVRAAGQAGQRRARAGEAVGGLVDRAVAAERDDDVVVRGGGLAAQLDRVALGLGVDRRDLVAALERVERRGSSAGRTSSSRPG